MKTRTTKMYFPIILLLLSYNLAGKAESVNKTEEVEITNTPPTSASFNGINSVRNNERNCIIKSSDPYVYNKIKDVLSFNVKLLEYVLNFEEYDYNPLEVNNTWTYRSHKWARAYSQHGQTLLSLAFNYGVMSLMTLTLGVHNMEIPLVDEPKGCLLSLTEDEKINTVMFLLMRDFDDTKTDITIKDQERICHEVILKNGQYAKFTDRCCHIDPITKNLTCTTDIINIWLKILFFCLASVKFGLLFFGPVFFISVVESVSKDKLPYVVKLKDPLVKTIYLCNSRIPVDKTYDKVVDLRGKKGLPKLRESVKNVPLGEPVKVKFTRYDILVNYNKLLVENDVPVGVCSSFIDNFCGCKIRQVGPFKDCCEADICKSFYAIDAEVTWLYFFKQLVKVLVVLVLPLPFYLRLLVFYGFEYQDLETRALFLDTLNLKESYDGAILSYLRPNHPLFICIYVLYFLTAFVFFLAAVCNRQNTFKRILFGSFKDLKNLKWIDALGVFVGNMIWPFKRFGGMGCALAPIYWLIFFPLCILMYAFYCLPSIYVSFRMLVFSAENTGRTRTVDGMYKVVREKDNSMFNFETEHLIHSLKRDKDDIDHPKVRFKRQFNFKIIEHVLLAILCIATMFGVLLVMAECAGFVVEMLVFTLMGVIVNAGAVLKYVTLLILVIVYSYDCYNNVGKKYLKLNKSLFTELKSRCKEVEKVTSLPSHLQENYGFKSQELSEQADYEAPDGIDDSRPNSWMLNDLVLFVDNEDMPRIPRDLFEQVCGISVAGAPGPVYQSLIDATQDFLKILVFIFFVFIVVLTFGQVYQVSSTNQMLATLAGGFLPFIMKTFLTPNKPDIEIGTVSFKSRLDEIIKNFQQNWPIYDLPFERWTAEDEQKLKEAEEEKNKDSKSKDENDNHKCKCGVMNNATQTDNSNIAVCSSNNVSDKASAALVFKPDSEDMATDGDRTSDKWHQPGNGLIHPGPSTGIELQETKVQQQANNEFDVDILILLPKAKKEKEKWSDMWSDFDELSQAPSTLTAFLDDDVSRKSFSKGGSVV